MNRQAVTSVQPKTHYYKTDGTGRDLYIACDSGGHFKFDGKLGSRPNTAGYKIRPMTPNTIGSKSVHYNPDGSGRDFYIKVSDGGLHSLTYRGQNFFTGSLRTYPKLTTVRSATDLLTWSKGWQTARTRSISRINRMKTTNCVTRLTHSKTQLWT